MTWKVLIAPVNAAMTGYEYTMEALNGHPTGDYIYNLVFDSHHWTRNKVYILITSLAKEVMFLVALGCLSVCLSVCGQHYSKRYERIGVKFYGGVLVVQ